MNHLRLFSPLAVLVFLASSAFATTPQPAGRTSVAARGPVEATGVQHTAPSNGPIVVNWQFKKAPGLVNLVVNQDGTYIFSGHYKRKVPNKDIEIVLALKSSLGAVYLFHYVANAANGVQWSKQGQSAILKDDFKTFRTKHDWAGSYKFWLTAEYKEKLQDEKQQQRDYCRWVVQGGFPAYFNGTSCVLIFHGYFPH